MPCFGSPRPVATARSAGPDGDPASASLQARREAGVAFARSEGIIPAPETTHAIAQVIQEAKKAKEEGVEKTIVFNFSGHGLVDLAAYDQYLKGQLQDYTITDKQISESIHRLDGMPEVG